MTFRILQGDNRDTLKTLADNSIDAIVTDPPYGIDFLGKSWDANTGALETYQECLRVLKPGGHILAFSAARTYHHLAVTLEQAGFEIRDQIMWIYSSGFPKSQDIGRSIQRSLGVKKKKTIKSVNGLNTKGLMNFNEEKGEYTKTYDIVEVTDPVAKQWEGWGTALKPAHEPIALARKPLHKSNSIARNCQQWGVGAINIDATRVNWDKEALERIKKENAQGGHPGGGLEKYSNIGEKGDGYKVNVEYSEQGRFPSNVIGEILQADYQKYFYCPKVSRKERHIGFDTTDIPTNPNGMWDDGVQFQNQQAFSGATKKGNNHPTVKPVELMKYLIKLITPPGGTVLDPFNGSGSTGCAAVELGFEYIGCELDPDYVKIAETRILAWANKDAATNNYGDLFE
jgi:site-specific DNA-methyltransferase (adenine-specific)